ncbi:MAG TPA: PCRF domain-containing protein, partial [Ktedonobacterales bacterium]|nr:PCRF domain-containing protein [Ktedonobacterales bacterium]
MSDPLLDKLTNLETRYEELTTLMVQPDVIDDPQLLERYGREYATLEPLITKYRDLKETLRQRRDTEEMLGNGLDDDLRALAREELDRLRRQEERLLEELRVALRPKDVMDERNVIMTIQAGAGGDEAGLFAADLFRMYSRYAEDKRWNLEVLDSNESGIGGFKEIVFEVRG